MNLIFFIFISFFSFSPSQISRANSEKLHPFSCKSIVERSVFEKAYRSSQNKEHDAKSQSSETQGQPVSPNRLIHSSSPYLQQHAYNPINWYPWGQEAFDEAIRSHRPIFLSVGYSACHWCHVMEAESFKNQDIADYMNRHYVPIKVDREEHPHVDSLFQQLKGGGGWPLTVFLKPNKDPFYAITYLPPDSLMTLLRQVTEAYTSRPPEELIGHFDQRASMLLGLQNSIQASDFSFHPTNLKNTLLSMKPFFDKFNGGRQGTTKFPTSFPTQFLLRQVMKFPRLAHHLDLPRVIMRTLKKMALGGLYDQIGGGFHRYSTDPHWRIPHFEKMLDDNALLAVIYLEAYQFTRDPFFKDVVEDILGYVEREMSSDQKAFYSSTDADSLNPSTQQKEEGHFFTWSLNELKSFLPEDELRFITEYYNIGTEEKRTLQPDDRYVLYVHWDNRLFDPLLPVEDFFLNYLQKIDLKLKSEISSTLEFLSVIKQKMYQFRLKKPLPMRDEKIILAWNALMISAYAQSGFVLNRRDYLTRAEEAADFILTHMTHENRLLRIWREGFEPQTHAKAQLDDYAFFIASLLSLYEYTGSSKWLEEAIRWNQVLEDNFEDTEVGGFFRVELSQTQQEDLIIREKPFYDGAEPSGNSIQALNLLRLSLLTSEIRYRKKAKKIFSNVRENVKAFPLHFSQMLLALDFYLGEQKEVFIVTPDDHPHSKEIFLEKLRQVFDPHRVLTIISDAESLQKSQKGQVRFEGKRALEQKVTAYVCRNQVCFPPTQNPEEFLTQISSRDLEEED